MCKLAKIFLFFAFFALALPSFAAEADHYTDREKPLIDITERLNQNFEKYFLIAITTANDDQPCDESIKSETKLYEQLRVYFHNHTHGELVSELLMTDWYPKRSLLISESVYQDWSTFNGFILARGKATGTLLGLSPMIKIGGQLLGVDKLEHMFGMGFTYFKKYYLQGKSLSSTLKNGIFRERTLLGGSFYATGVFAFSDLSANFNGMRFWNHILQKRPDVMGEEHKIGPYLRCQSGKWIRTSKKFDIAYYVDASMDESINCSQFASAAGARKFRKSLVRLGYADEKDNSGCPLDQNKFDQMFAKYNVLQKSEPDMRPLSYWILNFEGIKEVKGLPPYTLDYDRQ